MEESAFKISGQLSSISRHQKYFRTRENRNFATVRSTEKRIINFSLIQCGLIVLMGALQVFIVKFFFQVLSHLFDAALLERCALADQLLDFRAQGRDTYERKMLRYGARPCGLVSALFEHPWEWKLVGI